MIRILQHEMTERKAGTEAVMMNWYRNIDRKKVQFDFLLQHSTHRAAYEKEIKELGGNIYPIHYRRKKEFFKYWKEIKKIFINNPDIKGIHMHMNTLDNILPLVIAKRCGVQIRIVHSHNGGENPSSANLLFNFKRKIMQFVIRKLATQFFACSKVAGDYMFGNKIDYTIINNGIDVMKYKFCKSNRDEIRTRLNLEHRIVFGFVGRLEYQKNPLYMLRLFYEYYKKDSTSRLIVIGDGSLKDDCTEYIIKKNILNSVIFLDPTDDVYKYYSAFDIFLLPSHFEGLPLVLVEAQANGLPCVCSDKVSKEVEMSDLVQWASIESPPMDWLPIFTRINLTDWLPRELYYKKIINQFYDIKQVAKQIEKYYMDHSYK